MKKNLSICFILVLFIFYVFTGFSYVSAMQNNMDIQSKSAILMDYETGTILYEKNPHEKMPIASLNKIMTILLAIEAINDGKISLNDTVQISEYAASMGGSQVFLHAGEVLTVDSLLKAIVVASGNDASVAIAEKIAGSHEAFVSRMNLRAKELGMRNTNFANATGLPAENNYSTAYDVALMSQELLKHPLFFRWSTIWLDTLDESSNKTELTNTNRLIRFYDGADGLKTGSTQEAGYCLSATAKRGNMRLLAVVLNAPSSKVRFSESIKMLDYGFANYEIIHVLKKDQIIKDNIFVSGGKEERINGLASKNVNFLIRSGESKEFEMEVSLNDKINAPLKKGDKIGTLVLTREGQVLETIDIVSDRDLGRANVFDYFKKIFYNWTRK